MAAEKGTCEVCGRPVLAYQKAAYPVSGWEIERDKGGANRILGRKRTPDRVAHAVCIEERYKRGDQKGLF